jgi:hypothetical protein
LPVLLSMNLTATNGNWSSCPIINLLYPVWLPLQFPFKVIHWIRRDLLLLQSKWTRLLIFRHSPQRVTACEWNLQRSEERLFSLQNTKCKHTNLSNGQKWRWRQWSNLLMEWFYSEEKIRMYGRFNP